MRFLGGYEDASALHKVVFGLTGLALVILVWTLLTTGSTPVMNRTILPNPLDVLFSFEKLITENQLIRNVALSIGRNVSGYLEAILLCIPIGFIVGLMKFPRLGFKRQVDAFRFIPLTALIGVFIAWFGISVTMKVHFLAFGIVIYLLPVMIQRIDELDDVYLKTVHTLGATDWQILKTVYFPSVMSRMFDDLRVLTAISWTYIIVIETTNGGEGGIGALIYTVGQRMVMIDRLYALLIVIILIGVVQDRIFASLDKAFFPFKYQAREAIRASKLDEQGFLSVVWDYIMMVGSWIGLAIYGILLVCDCFGLIFDPSPLVYLFGKTAWVMHILFFCVLAYKLYAVYTARKEKLIFQQVVAKTTGK